VAVVNKTELITRTKLLIRASSLGPSAVPHYWLGLGASQQQHPAWQLRACALLERSRPQENFNNEVDHGVRVCSR